MTEQLFTEVTYRSRDADNTRSSPGRFYLAEPQSLRGTRLKRFEVQDVRHHLISDVFFDPILVSRVTDGRIEIEDRSGEIGAGPLHEIIQCLALPGGLPRGAVAFDVREFAEALAECHRRGWSRETQKRFFRTYLVVEVLSEDPIPSEGIELDAIAHEIVSGSMSGMIIAVGGQSMNGRQTAQMLTLQSSDPGFFSITEDGEDAHD